jgi:uncharacterized protein
MIIVAGALTVEPSGRDAYLEGCAAVVAAAREAHGCHDFALSPDLLDPARINVYERWATEEDLHRFRGSGPEDAQLTELLNVAVREYSVVERAPGSEPPADLAGGPATLTPDAPLARRVTEVIRSGDAAALQQLLREHPELATARIGDPGCGSRTLLHLVTDWPGSVPEAGAKIAVLVAAGADVNARFTGAHTETPLHWAASGDDVEALDALLDAGADLEADGAVIAGSTPIADAVAFGQWAAAHRLLERGARTNLWQAAALGLLDRVHEELAQGPRTQNELDNALWCAAHGGQRETAELLLGHGADPAWIGHDNLTAAAAAKRSGAHELTAWLREQAARGPSTD